MYNWMQIRIVHSYGFYEAQRESVQPGLRTTIDPHNVYYVNMDTMHVYVHYVQYGGVVEVLETASQYMSTLSTLHGSSLCWNS